MNKFIRTITVRIVGVSFKNDDGSSRQRIISKLESGDPLCLEHYDYSGEPAYSVTTLDDECIGNLPKDLSFDIFNHYRDYSIDASVNDVIGGEDGQKYGCVIDIDFYEIVSDEQVSEFIPDSVAVATESVALTLNVGNPKYSNFMYRTCGFILCTVSVLLFLISLALLPVGIIFSIVSVLLFIMGRTYLKIVKNRQNQ